MREITPGLTFIRTMLNNPPAASAWVTGNRDYPGLSGLVKFYSTDYEGTLIEAEFFGLPNVTIPGSTDFYAMHIHEFGDCTPPFDNTGGHYNRAGRGLLPHPEHSGDLIPLFGNQGYAWTSFYDKRIIIPEVIGRSVVVHQMRDDFTSQPAGDSGSKIACGVIRTA